MCEMNLWMDSQVQYHFNTVLNFHDARMSLQSRHRFYRLCTASCIAKECIKSMVSHGQRVWRRETRMPPASIKVHGQFRPRIDSIDLRPVQPEGIPICALDDREIFSQQIFFSTHTQALVEWELTFTILFTSLKNENQHPSCTHYNHIC